MVLQNTITETLTCRKYQNFVLMEQICSETEVQELKHEALVWTCNLFIGGTIAHIQL